MTTPMQVSSCFHQKQKHSIDPSKPSNTRTRCPSPSPLQPIYTTSNKDSLDILAQPPDPLAVPLPHDDAAHEHLDRPDALERHLALARGLVHAELVAELVLRHGVRVVDLVAQDQHGHLGQLLHGQQRVQLGLGLGEPLVVLGVHQEDDAVHFREVVLPEAAG
jgi:hypothetical protein